MMRSKEQRQQVKRVEGKQEVATHRKRELRLRAYRNTWYTQDSTTPWSIFHHNFLGNEKGSNAERCVYEDIYISTRSSPRRNFRLCVSLPRFSGNLVSDFRHIGGVILSPVCCMVPYTCMGFPFRLCFPWFSSFEKCF